MIRYTASRPNINTGVVDINVEFRAKREKALNRIHRSGTGRLKNYRRDGDINTDEMARNILCILIVAADNGHICPTNRDICERLNINSITTASTKVSLLEAAGLISVYRAGNSRVIEIVASGKKTIPMNSSYANRQEVTK